MIFPSLTGLKERWAAFLCRRQMAWEDSQYRRYKARIVKTCSDACKDEKGTVLAAYPFLIWIELQLDKYYEHFGLEGALKAVNDYPDCDPLPTPPNPRQHIIDEIEEVVEDAGEVSADELSSLTGFDCSKMHLEPDPEYLTLHFSEPSQAGPCLAAMREETDIPFEVDYNASVSMRDMMTNPDALNVKKSVRLKFRNEEALILFRRDCHLIYVHYATGGQDVRTS